MGIAGALLIVVMLFSSSLSMYEEEVNVSRLNRKFEVVKIERKSIVKELKEAKKDSADVTDKLLMIREQLRIEVSEKKRIQEELEEKGGGVFVEPSLESDEEKAKIIEGLKKMVALEAELESLTQEHKRLEYLMRNRDAEARLRVEELIAENNALLEELEAVELEADEDEEFAGEADSSSLGQMVQELASENVELKSKLEAAENALKEFQN